MATGRATFARMQDSTAADYDIITARRIEFLAGYADRVLDALRLLDEGTEGYAVSGWSTRCNPRLAHRKTDRDDDYVAMCLLHDIGDTLAPRNHGELAASILKPFVPERITWIAAHHPVFQLAYYGHHVGADPESRARATPATSGTTAPSSSASCTTRTASTCATDRSRSRNSRRCCTPRSTPPLGLARPLRRRWW